MVIKCEQWSTAGSHLSRSAVVSFEEPAKRSVDGPCTQLSLQTNEKLSSWFADRPAVVVPEQPPADLLAENIRLSEELARVERSKRRCVLQSDQRKAEMEQELSSMRNLITQMLHREPSLQPLAATAGFALEEFSSADLSLLQVDASEQIVEHLMSQNARLLDENRRLAAELADKKLFDADSARLEYENQRQDLERAQRARVSAQGDDGTIPRTLSGWLADDHACSDVDYQQLPMQSADQWLWTENRQLQEEKDRLAAELSRAERERRRLVLLEAQSRADLEQCQQLTLLPSSGELQCLQSKDEADASERVEVVPDLPVIEPCHAEHVLEDVDTHVAASFDKLASSQNVSSSCHHEVVDLKIVEQLSLLLHRVSEDSDRIDVSIAQGASSVLDLIRELEAQWEAAESRWHAVSSTMSCIAAEAGTQTLDWDSQVDGESDLQIDGESDLPLPPTTPSSPRALADTMQTVMSSTAADMETQTVDLDKAEVHTADAATADRKDQDANPVDVSAREANEESLEESPVHASSMDGVREVSAALEAMDNAVQRVTVVFGPACSHVPIHPMTPSAEAVGCSSPSFQEDIETARSDYVSALPTSLCDASEVNVTSQHDAAADRSTDSLDPAALHAILQQLGEPQVHLRSEVLEALGAMEEHKSRLREEVVAMQEECSRMTSNQQPLSRESGLDEVDRMMWMDSGLDATGEHRSIAPEESFQLRKTRHRAFEAYANLAADCERHMSSQITAAEMACAQVAEEHQRKLEEQFVQACGQVANTCSEHSAAYSKGQEQQQQVTVRHSQRQFGLEAHQPMNDIVVDTSAQLTAAFLSQQQQLVEQRTAAALAHARAEALRAELCRREQQQQQQQQQQPVAGSVLAGSCSAPLPQAQAPTSPRWVRCGSSEAENPVLDPAGRLEPGFSTHQRHAHQETAGVPQQASHPEAAGVPQQVRLPPDCFPEQAMHDSEVQRIVVAGAENCSKMDPMPSRGPSVDSREADSQELEVSYGKDPGSSLTSLWKAMTPKVPSEVHPSPPRSAPHNQARRDVDNDIGLQNTSFTDEASPMSLSRAEMFGCSTEPCVQSVLEAALVDGGESVGAGTHDIEDRAADEAELAREVQQLWEEERRLTANVVAVRFVSETVQAFYEREAVVAARESSEQLQEAAHWHAAKARAESRRAELSQEEAAMLGLPSEKHALGTEGFNSSASPERFRGTGSRKLSMELQRRDGVHASIASGSPAASSSEEESSPSSEFAFQLGPRSSLHKRSCKRRNRGDTSVWSQITRYQLAGESDNEHPGNPASSRAGASGGASVRLGPLSPRRHQQAWPHGGCLRRSRTLPPMEIADLAVSDGGGVLSPGARPRGGMRRVGSFSHMPRDGAGSMSPKRVSQLSGPSVDSADDSTGGAATGNRRIAGHRRVNSGPVFRNYSNSPAKGKHKRVPSNSGTLLQVLGTLTPHRRSSSSSKVPDEPMSPGLGPLPLQASTRSLIEGFFHIVSGQNGTAEAQLCWPGSVRKSNLEQAVVGDGFCPNPEVFSSPDPAGFNSEPFVFSLLETTLDPSGDPSGVLYGCVCSDTGGLVVDPCAKRPGATDEQGRALASPRRSASRSQNHPQPGVLCIVSKWPLFALLFEILGLLRCNLACVEPLLERICSNGFGENFATEGVDIADFHCGMNRLRLRLPRPPQCDWESLAYEQILTPLGAVSQAFAQWQAAWGLSALIARWDNLVGDTLAKLLACVLLEQKVMLLGDVPRASTMALVLRGLIWPFRWLHPYLSAPPPPELLHTPFPESPTPLIISLTELPKEWNYRTHYELPPDVVTGVLKHDYIYVSPELETTGGLKGTSIKLPAGRHTAFRQQVTQAKKRLRTGELDHTKAVTLVQEAAETEVRRLVDLIRRYVTAQVDEVKKAAISAKKEDPGRVRAIPATAAGPSVVVRGVLRASMALGAVESLESIRECCCQQAADVETFTSWFKTANPEASANSETLGFYRTFFQTQLCLDFMNEEINVQTA